MEPNYDLLNIAIGTIPFLCYFAGICIRKVVLPGPDSPPLSHQLLIGIPMSLAIVCPFIPILKSSLGDFSALGITLGVIIEHGMLINETATNRLKKLGQNLQKTT
ncbi:MAG: hypothetical protein GY714_30880 [Desulfobacterales bacterium]|nr:hypothetical protein [Desulfobacterales bacterium]MCP4163599.1 hypothetical protein [Deltaproteobacteria bacterium]